jgi:dephospho-CoA kinase
LKADELGHELLARGGACFEATVAAFGREILAESGEIDRKALGAIVFADPGALSRLNAIVHPAVFAREREWLNAIEIREAHAIAIVEAAILIETGNYKSFDKLIVTWCPEALQIERALQRGASEADIRRRLARQMPADEKRRYADYLIDTSFGLAETDAQTRTVYEKLLSLEREGLHS